MGASPYTTPAPVCPDDPEGLLKSQLSLLPATLEDEFNRFHARHPEVAKQLLGLARQARARGHKTYSIDCLFHLVRWHMDVERDDHDPCGDGFKLNDHFTAYYARLLMQEHPELVGFFRIRKLRSAA
jgi:hypothetical protein